MSIQPGTRVEVTTALRERVPMRALSGPEHGRDFMVVWVTTEAEYAEAGLDAQGIPWPVEDVRAVAGSSEVNETFGSRV